MIILLLIKVHEFATSTFFITTIGFRIKHRESQFIFVANAVWGNVCNFLRVASNRFDDFGHIACVARWKEFYLRAAFTVGTSSKFDFAHFWLIGNP